MEKEKIYLKAIERYGLRDQIDMVFEEMSELQKELCKFKRGKDTTDNIAEEIADVKIMLEQMEVVFDIKDKVQFQKDLKVKRLENRLIRK